jgi:hypothetical protein
MQSQSRWSRLGVTSAVLLATAGAFIGYAGAAGASSPPAPNPQAKVHPLLGRPLSAGKASVVATTMDFVGYVASPAAGVASMSVTFKVPTVTCPASGASAYVGLGVETYSAGAMMYIFCAGSGAAAEYAYDLSTPSGDEFEPAAAAGDTVVATIFETGSTTQAEIHDLTNGQFWLDADTSYAPYTYAWFGAFTATDEDYQVPSFPAFAMSNAQLNGDFLGFESPAQYDDYSAGSGDTVITAGSLKTTASGSSFKLTFKKND